MLQATDAAARMTHEKKKLKAGKPRKSAVIFRVGRAMDMKRSTRQVGSSIGHSENAKLSETKRFRTLFSPFSRNFSKGKRDFSLDAVIIGLVGLAIFGI